MQRKMSASRRLRGDCRSRRFSRVIWKGNPPGLVISMRRGYWRTKMFDPSW
jgi:hypothetical protein